MSLDADVLVDRRKMRRKLTFWRVATFLIVTVGLIGAIIAATDLGSMSKRSSHIARLAIDGVILEDRKQLKLIEKIGESNAVKGVIVSINSPGGSTTGGEALYEALRELADKKPVVAEIRTVGASAGYMIALASDHIVARYNSITGSIGVLFQYGNIAKLMDMVGVEMDAVKSSPLKAEPDFYSETSPEAKEVLNALVMDSYDWFVDLVAERRDLSPAKARALANGSIYSGHAAQENGLIDAIGGEKSAISWLETEKSVAEDLPVLNWSVQADDDGLPLSVKMTQGLGNGIANGLIDELDLAKWLISPAITLDGLVSVWQAPGAAKENSAVRGGGQ
ncbi:signal peptide peptidase SppA [Roseibium polysiphoniae]|uniref:signal peptide peptidase SppA n=1 Tax=Roseibium polysiphoniae TaxID=2571221 RepID=UPI003299D218